MTEKKKLDLSIFDILKAPRFWRRIGGANPTVCVN